MRLVVLQSDGRPGDTETEGETDVQRERRKETEHDTEMDRDGECACVSLQDACGGQIRACGQEKK